MAALGIHRKPIGLLNVESYFDPLLVFAKTMVDERFVREEQGSMLAVEATPDTLLARLRNPLPPPVDKWFERIKPAP